MLRQAALSARSPALTGQQCRGSPSTFSNMRTHRGSPSQPGGRGQGHSETRTDYNCDIIWEKGGGKEEGRERFVF